MLEMPPIPEKEYFTIGEVSRIAQVPAYVLRYWESEFSVLRPPRRDSGQRKYMKKDIETIFQVKDLLYSKKFTIAGAKKFITGDRRKKEDGFALQVEMGPQAAIPEIDTAMLGEIKNELQDILKMLQM
jgi:DNA-binding transcriptional MerR regulator